MCRYEVADNLGYRLRVQLCEPQQQDSVMSALMTINEFTEVLIGCDQYSSLIVCDC